MEESTLHRWLVDKFKHKELNKQYLPFSFLEKIRNILPNKIWNNSHQIHFLFWHSNLPTSTIQANNLSNFTILTLFYTNLFSHFVYRLYIVSLLLALSWGRLLIKICPKRHQCAFCLLWFSFFFSLFVPFCFLLFFCSLF